MIISDKRREKGLTLIELIISVGIMMLIVCALLAFEYTSSARNKYAKDREFAARKAISILEEIRTAVEKSVDVNKTLDEINDQNEYRLVLTTHPITDPAHPLSSNVQTQGNTGPYWKFARNIKIESFAGTTSANVRMAKVNLAINMPDGQRQVLASVGSIIQAPAKEYPPSQIYDLYLLTAESSPSWWVHMSKTKDSFESQLMDLMARNPGLTFRTHWITTSGYGRNPLYLPYLNWEKTSIVDKMAFGYIYPGKHEYSDGTTNPGLYYWPDIFQGRINQDGVIKNDYRGQSALDTPQADAIYNPWPHALCDRFNQAMRYPDELEYYEKKKSARELYQQKRREYIKAYNDEIQSSGSSTKNPKNMPEMPSEEPTFRLLLEDMVSNPSKYHNAIFINLHGELLPLPAIRNYSDAAKDPLDFAGARVVTHPEKIRTQIDTEDVKLRVYSHLSDLKTYTDTKLTTPITLFFPNMSFTSGTISNIADYITIKRVYGGYTWTRAAGGTTYGIDNAPVYEYSATPTNANEMYVKYKLLGEDLDGDTLADVYRLVVYLYNSPLQCPQVTGGSGLKNTYRLYGLEYIPCSPTGPIAGENFSRNLSNTTTDAYKNTARWIITIPRDKISSMVVTSACSYLKVETRIGDDFNGETMYPPATNKLSGTMYPPAQRHKPENLSTTYTWCTESGNAGLQKMPFSELFQFNGDPRHNPYVDNIPKNKWVTTESGSAPDGYNPYFQSLSDASWPGVFTGSKTKNGWGSDGTEVDIPRYHQLVRRAIVNSEMLYTTLTGWSYYYVGVGGEIGVDSANGYPKSIEVNDTPYGGAGTSTVLVAEYTGETGRKTIHYLRKTQAVGNHPLLYWTGELYHDSDYRKQWGLEITALAPYHETADPLAPDTTRVVGGNVVAGAGNGKYCRVDRNDAVFGLFSGCKHRLAARGCGAILHIQNASGNIFTHHGTDGQTGTLQSQGEALVTSYAIPLPRTIQVSRPWSFTGTIFSNQYEFYDHATWKNSFFCVFQGERTRLYYDRGSSYTGSGLIKFGFRDDTSVNLAKASLDPFIQPDHFGYVAVNGIDRATEEDTATINKLSLLTLLHSFMELGKDYKARMLPRTKIVSPKIWEHLPVDPSTVTIKWENIWKRWDGKPYTSGVTTYPPSSDQGFPFRVGVTSQENDNLFFVPMITSDLAQPWTDLIKWQKGITNDAQLLRFPGERPADSTGQYLDYTTSGPYISTDADGNYVFNFNISDESRFPAGTYYFRVECFRKNEIQHYSYHQIILEVKRS